MSDTLRILVPDHPDLALGRAIDFAAALLHANDSDEEIEGWALPTELVDPALQAALVAIVYHTTGTATSAATVPMCALRSG